MSTATTGPTPNPAATEHLPYFVVAPGETDRMFVMVTIFVFVFIIGLGVFYFKLHSIPEHMAEEKKGNQLQMIGVLSLLALFTHNNYFWVAALVLATFVVPDFLTPIRSIARSMLRISRNGLKTEKPPKKAAQPDVAKEEVASNV